MNTWILQTKLKALEKTSDEKITSLEAQLAKKVDSSVCPQPPEIERRYSDPDEECHDICSSMVREEGEVGCLAKHLIGFRQY